MRGNVREMSGKIALDLESRKKIEDGLEKTGIQNKSTGEWEKEIVKGEKIRKQPEQKRRKRKRIGNQLERFKEKRRKKRNVNERRGERRKL